MRHNEEFGDKIIFLKKESLREGIKLELCNDMRDNKTPIWKMTKTVPHQFPVKSEDEVIEDMGSLM